VPRPPALHDHALDNLRFIRETMERAGAFTSVPGWGGVLMGVTAIATAALAGPVDGSRRWLAAWLTDAAVAGAIGLVAIAIKAQQSGLSLAAVPARRFALAYVPPLVAGAVLTVVFVRAGLATRLPGCWLLLYGTAVATGGVEAVRVVALMGICFMAAGVAALAMPAEWGNWMMAAGFGGLHIGFGLAIVRNYGG